MAVLSDTKTKQTSFPTQELESVLRSELMAAAEVEADINGISLPSQPGVAAVAPVPMDSLVVVELLCAVEPILGFAPKDATVRTGGYNSVQEALDHLMPRLEQQWQKKQGVSA
ncbi:hypothetical protein [Sulfitobacter sp. JB4-11]|uniref:hypothetical protein n=1 Tax=Sulfitobacter rhodophyticola TaxID=3238304 RepID=UPI0035149A2D